jgi:hypothetical protein
MNLVKTAARLAMRRGMKGGSREWLMTGVVLGLASWTRKRAAEQKDRVLLREVLSPGEAISIRVVDPRAGED